MGIEGVDPTLLSDTPKSIGLTESVVRGKVWCRRKLMNLCGDESEESEDGVGPGVNPITMSDVLYSESISLSSYR